MFIVSILLERGYLVTLASFPTQEEALTWAEPLRDRWWCAVVILEEGKA